MFFPNEAGEDLAHFDQTAPQQSEFVADFDLFTLAGESVKFHDFLGNQPVVLQLGSHSCPVYRYRRFGMDDLRREFSGRVEFVTVYTTEAHPTGSPSPYRDEEWLPSINRLTGIRVSQAETLDERLSQARASVEALNTQGIVLVDNMENEFWTAFGQAPSPGFIIFKGQIVLRQVWVEPEELQVSLNRLLEEPD